MDRLQQIAALLKSESTLVLATTDDAGHSRSTPLFYICDDELALYWFSSSSSGHSKDLKREAQAAAAVFRPTSEWRKICGVQMRGRVEVAKDRALRKTITAAYCQRFQLGTFFRSAISRSNLYKFRPSWIRYLDNARRFGYKFEVSLHEIHR